MIVHSSAGMAIITAAYLFAQSVIHPGAENRVAQATDPAPAGIAQAAANDHHGEKIASASAVLAAAEKQQMRKKVIVIGKNSVSVKYVTK